MVQKPRLAAKINASWLTLAVVLLGLAAAMGLNLRLEHQRVEAREQERLLAQSRVVQLVLDEQLSALNHVLGDVSVSWANRKNIHDFNARLTTLVEAMPGVRTLLILDAKGTVQVSSRPELIGKNFKTREYFTTVQQAPDPDVLYIPPPFMTSLGVFTMTLGRMVPGPQGEFGGLVSASLDPKFFAPLLEAINYAPDVWAFIAHGDGLAFLMRPHQEGVAGKNLLLPDTFFSQHSKSGRASSVFSGRAYVTGEDRMLAFRTIQPSGLKTDKPLVVGVSRDLDAVFVFWRSQAYWQAGLFLALALASGAGLSVFVRRKREFLRREAESIQALKDSEHFLRTVTDNIPGMVGYWTTDLRCGFANSAYQQWYGTAPAQLLGIRMQDLLGEDIFRKNEPHILAVLRGEPQHFERTLVKADGSTSHVMASYIPDHGVSGVKGFFVLVTDVTELKNSQLLLEERVAQRTEELRHNVQALEIAKTQAEAANRTKSAFLMNLSHELRTPLNPIVALTDLMLSAELSAADQREYLLAVQGASQHLLGLFNRLFELLELDDCLPVPGAVDLVSFKDLVLYELSPAAQAKGLALEGSVSPDLPQYVWADMRLLRLALRELLDNAVRFTEAGTVSLVLSLVEDGAAGSLLCLAVRDTGLGIPAERLADISSGLTQADAPLTKRFAGLGIGMAMTLKAVALLGGRLEVESSPAQGSTFRLLLPLVPADLAGSAPAPSAP